MKIVAFEGIDFSGKTSRLNSIHNDIQNNTNIKIKALKIPTALFYNKIRDSNPELLDFDKEFAQQVIDDTISHINKAKSEGVEILLLDRSWVSSIVYQKLDISDLNIPYKIDLLVYLKISHKQLMNRISKRDATKLSRYDISLINKDTFNNYIDKYSNILDEAFKEGLVKRIAIQEDKLVYEISGYEI